MSIYDAKIHRKMQIMVSCNFQSAHAEIAPDVKVKTFAKYCTELGYTCAGGTITRRITRLEARCLKCEIERSGVVTAIGKRIVAGLNFIGRTLTP